MFHVCRPFVVGCAATDDSASSYPAVHQPASTTPSAAFPPVFVTLTSAVTDCPGTTVSGSNCFTFSAAGAADEVAVTVGAATGGGVG